MLESTDMERVRSIRLATAWTRLGRIIQIGLLVLLGILVLASSSVPLNNHTEQVRAFTRQIEFDYAGWTLDAFGVKLLQSALGTGDYLSPDIRRQLVYDYLELVAATQRVESQIDLLYADPDISDPKQASAELRAERDSLAEQIEGVQPVAEAILQSQISYVLDGLDLSIGGQPFPPVLYHSTPLPMALIVSPRHIIRQDHNISLLPDLSVDEQVQLEASVDANLDVSSLVVRIGGVGVYPSMVQRSTNLVWLSEVIAHEWVHNFLTLRPLGMNYLTSPELRIMNETTASIAGKEIGLAVLEAFYPELLPEPAPPESEVEPPPTSEPPAFDYRAEMHQTRLRADELLADGKIEEAEAYMEARRVVFWENGYRHLRKLNQAYFAFYGAYADQPGGAAGATEDPVGEAVRALRAQSPSLAAFLNRISWISSFEELLQVVEQGE